MRSNPKVRKVALTVWFDEATPLDDIVSLVRDIACPSWLLNGIHCGELYQDEATGWWDLTWEIWPLTEDEGSPR